MTRLKELKAWAYNIFIFDEFKAWRAKVEFKGLVNVAGPTDLSHPVLLIFEAVFTAPRQTQYLSTPGFSLPPSTALHRPIITYPLPAYLKIMTIVHYIKTYHSSPFLLFIMLFITFIPNLNKGALINSSKIIMYLK